MTGPESLGATGQLTAGLLRGFCESLLRRTNLSNMMGDTSLNNHQRNGAAQRFQAASGLSKNAAQPAARIFIATEILSPEPCQGSTLCDSHPGNSAMSPSLGLTSALTSGPMLLNRIPGACILSPGMRGSCSTSCPPSPSPTRT